MGIAIASGPVNGTSNTSGITSLATSSGLTSSVGDLIVVEFAGNLFFNNLGGNTATTSVSDTYGNTYSKIVEQKHTHQSTNDSGIEKWTTVVTTGGSGNIVTITFSHSLDGPSATIVATEYSGFGGTPTLDKSDHVQGTGSNTITSNSFTTTAANELLTTFCSLGDFITGQTWTQPSGWTLEYSNTGAGGGGSSAMYADDIVSSVFSGTISVTNSAGSSAGTLSLITATFKGPSVSGDIGIYQPHPLIKPWIGRRGPPILQTQTDQTTWLPEGIHGFVDAVVGQPLLIRLNIPHRGPIIIDQTQTQQTGFPAEGLHGFVDAVIYQPIPMFRLGKKGPLLEPPQPELAGPGAQQKTTIALAPVFTGTAEHARAFTGF